MTIYEYRTLDRPTQLLYRWIVYDHANRHAVGFFRTAQEADAMTARCNAQSAFDANGLLQYQTIEEED